MSVNQCPVGLAKTRYRCTYWRIHLKIIYNSIFRPFRPVDSVIPTSPSDVYERGGFGGVQNTLLASTTRYLYGRARVRIYGAERGARFRGSLILRVRYCPWKYLNCNDATEMGPDSAFFYTEARSGLVGWETWAKTTENGKEENLPIPTEETRSYEIVVGVEEQFRTRTRSDPTRFRRSSRSSLPHAPASFLYHQPPRFWSFPLPTSTKRRHSSPLAHHPPTFMCSTGVVVAAFPGFSSSLLPSTRRLSFKTHSLRTLFNSSDRALRLRACPNSRNPMELHGSSATHYTITAVRDGFLKINIFFHTWGINNAWHLCYSVQPRPPFYYLPAADTRQLLERNKRVTSIIPPLYVLMKTRRTPL